MITFTEVVRTKAGLHGRPLAQFLAEANKHKSSVQIAKVGVGKWVNGKSILSVLSLGVGPWQEFEVRVEGEDEQQAADALRALIADNFGEEVAPRPAGAGEG